MITFLNEKGQPIHRKCSNCKHFIQQKHMDNGGYCKMDPKYFCFTMKPTVYAIVKGFYLCDKHVLPNEETLIQSGAATINMEDVIKNTIQPPSL